MENLKECKVCVGCGDCTRIPFYAPFPTFMIKSDKKDPYTVYLEASNEEFDTQGETVLRKALEDEAESYLRKGILSWDHLHKLTGDPEFIIGEPQDVQFKKDTTFVKGRLYKDVPKAKGIVSLLKSGCTRLGASIGGFIREKKNLGKALASVLKIIWDETAITYKPVNDRTRGKVSLIPIGAFAKALAAGSGVDTATFTGGRAISSESLQGSTVKVDDLMGEFAWRLEQGDIKTEDDLSDFLEYHNVPFLQGNLKKVLVGKYN
ncbi:hypothetical protein LCGC14_1114000 [marine sediment metagenome]|uniref:Uncharacterized protein n=1 Tax=marine sediment metagenome TaxID=412755 RepID=A0A0F9M5Z7_9ZZZZ